MSFYAVILAGGRGKRFWPVSREHRPKQFLPIVGSESMIRQTVNRIIPIIPPEHIIIITSQILHNQVSRELPEIPEKNLLLEPIGRNTAPAIAWASMVLQERDPEAVLVVLASDHVIGDVPAFQNLIQAAVGMASETNYIVTLGIRPDRPETGYGYIKLADEIDSSDEYSCFQVDRFVEKPDLNTAIGYMQSGCYVWNSGMFIFTAARMINEISRFQPEIKDGIAKIIAGNHMDDIVREVFPALPDISIDYGIIEKADNICNFVVDFKWADVGSWEAIYDYLNDCGDGNRTNSTEKSSSIFFKSKNTLIHGGKRLIVSVGLENIVIVETDDAILVCDKKHAQDVGNIVKVLENNPDWNKYL